MLNQPPLRLATPTAAPQPAALEPPGAWAALGASVLTVLLCIGTRASFAAFFHPIEADLHLDRATLAASPALLQLVSGLLQPLAGGIAVRFGARPVMMAGVLLLALSSAAAAAATQAWQLLLFAGLLPGIAAAAATNAPAAVLIAGWFDRRLGLATGLQSAGIPAGQALFVPVAVLLIPLLGWRWAHLVLGAILAALALPVLYMFAREPARPRRRSIASSALPEEPIFPHLMSHFSLLIAGGFLACGFTDQFVLLHLVALASEAGVPAVGAATSLSALLLLGIGGSVASGPLADCLPPHLVLGACYLLRAAALPLLLLLPGAARWPALAAFVALFGVTYISNQAPGTRLVRDRYGVYAVGPLMGGLGLAHSVGAALGITAGGLSVSLAGSYAPAIILAASVALTGAALQFCVPLAARRAASAWP